jgi:SPP1 family predicted phage head-tail adaptor
MASGRMHSGMLRQIVSVQTRSTVRTATGGYTESWATAATRKAAVDSEIGRKFFAAMQAETERSVTVVMRYYDGLTTKDHRLLYGARAFNIVHIRNLEERKQWMVMLCKEDGA